MIPNLGGKREESGCERLLTVKLEGMSEPGEVEVSEACVAPPVTEAPPAKKEVKLNKEAAAFVPRVTATEFVPKSAPPQVAVGAGGPAPGNKGPYRDYGPNNGNYQV